MVGKAIGLLNIVQKEPYGTFYSAGSVSRDKVSSFRQ